MAGSFPKFERKLKENLIQPNIDQQYLPTYGIVLNYNPNTNRGSIAIAHHGSDALGEIFNDVVMPMTFGQQGVAPTPGTQIGVVFKDGNIQNPMVTHYFSNSYQDVHNIRQSRSANVTPRFMFNN